MQRPTLPLILSLPHGGLDAPDEVAGRLAISETDIFNECDLWNERIALLQTLALEWLERVIREL